MSLLMPAFRFFSVREWVSSVSDACILWSWMSGLGLGSCLLLLLSVTVGCADCSCFDSLDHSFESVLPK